MSEAEKIDNSLIEKARAAYRTAQEQGGLQARGEVSRAQLGTLAPTTERTNQGEGGNAPIGKSLGEQAKEAAVAMRELESKMKEQEKERGKENGQTRPREDKGRER